MPANDKRTCICGHQANQHAELNGGSRIIRGTCTICRGEQACPSFRPTAAAQPGAKRGIATGHRKHKFAR